MASLFGPPYRAKRRLLCLMEMTTCSGRVGASNNWARGYHTDGLMLADGILDAARRDAEACDCLQGIQMVHAVGGGSGGGLGSLLLDHMRDEYPDRIIASYCIIPSPKVRAQLRRLDCGQLTGGLNEWMNDLSTQIQCCKTVKSRTVSTGQKGSNSTYNCPKRYVNEETHRRLWRCFEDQRC